MISIDANVLLYAANEDCPEQRRAEDFLSGLVDRGFDRVWNPLD